MSETNDPTVSKQQYYISLPTELHKKLKGIAKEQQISLAELMRWCFRLGIVAIELASGYPKTAVLKDPEGDKEIHFIL